MRFSSLNVLLSHLAKSSFRSSPHLVGGARAAVAATAKPPPQEQRTSRFSSRSSSSSAGSPPSRVATFLPGDGIGPEIAKAVRQIFEVAGVPIVWEDHYFSPDFIDPSTQSMVTRTA